MFLTLSKPSLTIIISLLQSTISIHSIQNLNLKELRTVGTGITIINPKQTSSLLLHHLQFTRINTLFMTTVQIYALVLVNVGHKPPWILGFQSPRLKMSLVHRDHNISSNGGDTSNSNNGDVNVEEVRERMRNCFALSYNDSS